MNNFKKSILLATLAVVSTGALLSSLKAGVSPDPLICKDCNLVSCSGENDCFLPGNRHSYLIHAPIGVTGDHVHRKGGLMVSYRYMFMSMQQNYDGDSRVSDASARSGYMMVAQDMDMQMHMLGVMYAPTDKLTLMLMSNYIDTNMTMMNSAGVQSVMKSSGWGDVTLSAYYSLYRGSGNRAHLGLSLSVPTGSIDEKMSGGMHMGYPMQLGSGTWDIKPSVTWLGNAGEWSYGSQAAAAFHTGENDNDYTLGDSASLTGWVSRRLSTWSAVSLRLTGTIREDVDGHDHRMPVIPMGALAGKPMAAVVDPSARGGGRVDLSLGLNIWEIGNGARFAAEVGTPIYQNLNGPQLGLDWFLTLGLQMAW